MLAEMMELPDNQEMISIEESNKFMDSFFRSEPTMADMTDLQKYMETEMPVEYKIDIKPEHYFMPGLYGRELLIPAGKLVIGKRHARAHLTFLMKGKATIVTDEGIEVIEGPVFWQDAPGVKRAVYAHSDCVFVTAHAVASDNPVDAEKELMIREVL